METITIKVSSYIGQKGKPLFDLNDIKILPSNLNISFLKIQKILKDIEIKDTRTANYTVLLKKENLEFLSMEKE